MNKFHIEPRDVVRSSVARIKDNVRFYFSVISLVCIMSFCIVSCVLSCIVLFMLHSCALNW